MTFARISFTIATRDSRIGSSLPTSSSIEIWQEGLLIPPLRLYDRDRLREDVYDMIVLNMRHPRDFRGDVAGHGGAWGNPTCNSADCVSEIRHRKRSRGRERRRHDG